jgi:hypothetical protein
MRAPKGALIVSARIRFGLAIGFSSSASFGRSPVMPMVPAADAARTVVSPDHAAARAVIIGIIRVVIWIIIAADEAAMMVCEAEATMMKSTVTEAAAVECGTAAKAAAMEAASMHAAAMPAATATETSAVEAAAHVTTTADVTAAAMTATTAMTPTTMSASTADFGHKTTSDGSRRGRECRTNRRHRCRALIWRSGEQHHRCRSKAEAADKAPP